MTQFIPRRAAQIAPLLLFLFAAAPAFAAKPAVPDTVLAVFDGGFVTPTDFSQAWGNLAPNEYPPGDPLKSRQTYLGSVVDRMLLAREALKRNVVLTPEEEAEFERQKDLQIQNGLFGQLTQGLPQPTGEEIERLRRQTTTLAEIRFVTFSDWGRARSWRGRLSSGTPTSSLDAALRREGAKLGAADSFRFVAADQIPDTLALVVWTLRPGQVSEIHSFAGQPTLIQMRRFQDKPGISRMSNSELVSDFQNRQYNAVRETFRQKVAQDLKRTFDEEGMAFLLREQLKVPRRNDVDTVTGLPIVRATLPLPVIAPADTGRVLARAGGRAFTIGDYLRFWGRVQPIARPEIRDRGTLEGVVDRIALAPEISRIGRERGIDRDPRLVVRLERLRESFALDHYFRDEIQSKVKVEDSALRRAFAAKPGHYDDRASISSHILVVDRRSLADSLLARLKGGASFSELAREHSTDGESAANGGDVGIQYYGTQTNVGLEDAMFKTAVGQVGGPEQTPQGWVLWRIDGKSPGLKRTFEQAREMVERDFRITEADRLLNVRLAKLRKEAHVKLFPERVTVKLGADGPWGE